MERLIRERQEKRGQNYEKKKEKKETMNNTHERKDWYLTLDAGNSKLPNLFSEKNKIDK